MRLADHEYDIVAHYKDCSSRLVDARDMQYRGTKKPGSEHPERAIMFELSKKLKGSGYDKFCMYALDPFVDPIKGIFFY